VSGSPPLAGGAAGGAAGGGGGAGGGGAGSKGSPCVARSLSSAACIGSGAVGGADPLGAMSGSLDESDGSGELVPLVSLVTQLTVPTPRAYGE
jgi:hypothetical protein